MKLKLLVTALIATVGMNAFALEGKGFKVLSETIESSPGAVGGFVPQTPSSQPYVYADATAQNADGRTHENIRLSGSHRFNVSNYTKEKQIYNYKYEINCDGMYFRKTDKIEVSPGGYASDSASSFLYVSFSQPGNWSINAITEVTGESNGNHWDRATLRVEK